MPSTQTPSAPSPPPPAPATPTPVKHPIKYILFLGLLILGVLVGVALSSLLLGKGGSTPEVKTQQGEVILPTEAVRIQSCSDHRGTLYVKPNDIPVGPVYMVNNSKVIGIEFMLAKDEFLNGKSYKDLYASGIKVDHVNIGLLSQGHEGYPIPHYHVDIYTVPKETEEAIVCPGGATATPSASLNPVSASASALPK